VLVAPTAAGEGASTVTANLAVYLSKHLNHKVLLIDANLRQPAMHKLFKTSDALGLADVLSGKTPIEEAVLPVNENLDIMPAGQFRGNPLMLFDPERVSDMLQRARGMYEIVLLDSTNLKDYKDAQVLSTLVDSVALVIESGKTRYQTVRAVLTSLERKKVNILGAVLNKRIFHVPEIIYDKV
jgi:capsular exopolysaccharide synthesis family protein